MKGKRTKSETISESPAVFILNDGITVTLPKRCKITLLQIEFLRAYFKAWRAGEIPAIDSILKDQRYPGGPPDVLEAKVAGSTNVYRIKRTLTLKVNETHRARAAFALGLILMRSEICDTIMDAAPFLGQQEIGQTIELLIILATNPITVAMNGDVARHMTSLIFRCPVTMRAVATVMLKGSISWAEMGKDEKDKHRRFSSDLVNIFNPAKSLSFAIAIYWSHPTVRLFELAASPAECHKRFMTFYSKLKPKPSVPDVACDTFYRALDSIGLIAIKRPG